MGKVREKTNFYLLIANLILLAILLVNSAYKSGVTQGEPGINFALVESELARVVITSTKDTLELTYSDHWRTHQGFPVSPGRVQLLLQSLNSIAKGQVIEAGPAHYHRLMLDNPRLKAGEHSGILVEFFPRDGGAPTALIVGKAVPHHKNDGGRFTAWYPDRRYLRVLGAENALWLIDDSLAEVSISEVDWIDTHLSLGANFVDGSALVRPEKLSSGERLSLDPTELNFMFGAQVVGFVESAELENGESFHWPLSIKLEAQGGLPWEIRVAPGGLGQEQGYLSRLSGGVLSNYGSSPRYRVRIETSAPKQGVELWRDRELYIKSSALDSWFASKEKLRFMVGRAQ